MLLASSLALARPIVPVGSPEPQKQAAQSVSADNQSQTANVEHTYHFTPKQLWEVDGRLPPKVVLEFLEHPTMENAERYLAWVHARARKIDEAIALLQKIRQEKIEERIKRVPLSRINNSRIILVFSPECPYCLRELEIIKKIKDSYPNIGLVLYPVDNVPLAKVRLTELGLDSYMVSKISKSILDQVTAIPFIVIADKSTGRVKAEFVGVTSYEKIITSM